jgi:biopolymer transport protein ExbB
VVARSLPEFIEMSSSWSNPRALALLFMVGCGFSSHGETQGPPVDAPIAPPIDSPTVTPDGHPADWWNASWSHRRLITIDTTKLDTKLAGYPLTSFPVLVKLTPATIDYSAVKSDGSDLRFVLPGQTTPLSYDLDTFASGGTSLVWVRIPSLTTAATQPLFVYHGNPTATATTSGADVFGDSNISVHHLGADYSDATGHPHTGTPAGNPMTISDSPLGGARHFNGTTDYVTLPNEGDYDFFVAPSRLTVSAWIRVTAFNLQFQAIVTKGDTSWRLQRDDTSDHLEFGTTSGTNNDNEVGKTNVNNNQWHQAAVVCDGLKKLLYVDGAQDATGNYNLELDQNNELVAIGHNSQGSTGSGRFWDGDIDEVRISSIARAPAWIGAEYVTTTNPAFVTIGPDQRY